MNKLISIKNKVLKLAIPELRTYGIITNKKKVGIVFDKVIYNFIINNTDNIIKTIIENYDE